MAHWPGLTLLPTALREEIGKTPTPNDQLALTLTVLKQPRHVLCVGAAALAIAPWVAGVLVTSRSLILVDPDADRLSTLTWTLTLGERAHVVEGWHGNATTVLPTLEYTYDLAFVDTTHAAVWEQIARRTRIGGAVVALGDQATPAPFQERQTWLATTLRHTTAALFVRARDASWFTNAPRPLLAIMRLALGKQVWTGDENARILVEAIAADATSPPLFATPPTPETLLVCGSACQPATWPSGARWLTWGPPPFPPLFALTDEATIWAGVVP